MLDWLKLNIGTIIIIAVLAVIVVLIIRSILRDRKNGKPVGCGGDCAHCGGVCSIKAPDNAERLYRLTLKIEGMSCSMCESHVNDAFRNELKPRKVSSDAKKGETIIIAGIPYSRERLKGILDPIGYKLVSVSIRPLV